MSITYKRLFMAVALLLMTSLACSTLDLARDMLGRLEPTATPTVATASLSSNNWYVSVDGDDGNICDDPTRACRTIGEVLRDRATTEDAIFIGPGTFDGSVDTPRALGVVDMNLVIEGDGQGSTIIDGQNQVGGFAIIGDSRVTLRDLTVRNGGGGDAGTGNCITVRSTLPVVIEDVTVEHCTRHGISHGGDGQLRLVNVTARDAHKEVSDFAGVGVISGGGLVVEGGSFSENAGRGMSVAGAVEIDGARFENNGLDGLTIRGTADVSNIHVLGNDIDPVLGHNHAGVDVASDANATIRQATVENNDVGIRVSEGGQLRLEESSVSNHPRNGLLLAAGTTVTVAGSTIADNGSFYADTSLPAGIDNRGRLTISDSTVEGNHNGGIGNYRNLVMRNSTSRGNFGRLPGLYNAVMATAEVEGSLFVGQLGDSAAVENRGEMVMTNSTVSGNADIGVLAISAGGLTLRYVTVSENHIGLNSFNGGDNLAEIANSIFANNTGRVDCYFSSIAPDPPLAGFNLDSDGSCRFSTAGTLTYLGLGPLQDNGGPTMTHALEGDSPALDAATGDCPGTDQRGEIRPFGLACDVGAFELGGTTMSATLEPGALATITPTPSSSMPTVAEDTLCWKGPGPLYEVVSSLAIGTQVQILGRGVEGDWWVLDNPRYPGVRCWTPGEDIEVLPNYDYPDTLFEIPPLPTPTPVLGCLYYDQQQQEACFPMDQCPVDFDDSLGACTP